MMMIMMVVVVVVVVVVQCIKSSVPILHQGTRQWNVSLVAAERKMASSTKSWRIWSWWIHRIIDLDDGKILTGKPYIWYYLMVKTHGFPVKISPTKPIQWQELQLFQSDNVGHLLSWRIQMLIPIYPKKTIQLCDYGVIFVICGFAGCREDMGRWEKLQESPIFNGKIYGFL